ncbi:MAG: MFS transporter [Alphaproteobacteria bacterium]|nr:MFS transporter [Alphaproteobacteria bacterium]MBQ8729418.1 MFS transporter [Alphaproteobacteria bacterium]
MKKKSSLRRFLTNVYGYTFFNKLLLLSPVYAVFMQEHGMSDMALSSLFIILSVGTFMTQIPVTWITNKLGLKNAINLGQILKAIAFALWLVWPTFWGFAIGMFLWGVQSAFFNVAFEGLLYDELRARRHHDIYARVLGMRYNVSAVAAALSAFGSLLMFVGYQWITLASLVSIAISMICINRIQLRSHPHQAPKRVRKTNFMKLFRTGTRICVQTPCIFLMLMLTLLVSNICYLDDYLSPIGIEIGLPVVYVGLVQFFALGCSVLGQTFAHRFKAVPDWILYSSISLAGGLYVVFSVFYNVAGLWALGAAYALFAAIYILLYSRFQDFLPSSYRSVILSLYSIGDNVIYVITCLLIGLGGTMGSWRYSIFILGAIIMLIGLWALLFIKNRCAAQYNPNMRVLKTTHPVGDDIV